MSQSVLIIDDDVLWGKLLAKRCEELEVSVLWAKDGEEGLKKALELHPDVIILDVRMPKLNGFEVLERLRQDEWGKSVKILMLTSLAQEEEHLQKTIEHRPAFYLSKDSFTTEEIVEKIKELLPKAT